MTFPAATLVLAERVLERCRLSGLKLATAESCTGGLLAGCLTAVAGSSDVVDRGYVTYSNRAKTELLGVPEALTIEFGAVSPEVALAMAEGALDHSGCDIAVSLTGVAGPGGGTGEKPVGLVYMASARGGRESLHEKHVFDGDRDAVRLQAVDAALRLLLIRAE